jgi:acetaldehyde dehydrogenase
MKVAILGSGNIGTDLLIKILRSPYLECGVFIGRNPLSIGIKKARQLGVNTSISGIDYIQKNSDCCEIVFDATSAAAHFIHAPILKNLDKFTIDLTPAKIGEMCVPIINLDHILLFKNVNMITCGGQATLPIIYALSASGVKIQYIEIVSSIASSSAGPATRVNLDEYIHTTEQAIKSFAGISNAKAILNLNPALPCIDMQTTIFAEVKNLDINKFTKTTEEIEKKVQSYVPGYKILLNPLIENKRIIVIVQVKGQGDYLPDYAGNLDIINCAALAIAEKYAISRLNKEIQCEQS